MRLTSRKPADALGVALDPSALYEPLLPYGTASGEVYNSEVQLRGDHPEVQRVPAHWIAVNATSEEKGRVRAARLYPPPVALAEPSPPPPAIPPEHQAIARDSYRIGARTIHRSGTYDDRDEIVRKHPELFHRPVQPIEPDEAA